MQNENPSPSVTPEQIELALELERIFTPHAQKQREEAYQRQAKSGEALATQDLRFAHYTSAEAALSIIKSKRMWMRNTTCMADYREVQHGFDILNQFFSDKTKTDAFVAALDACVPGVA